ncbi:MAG: hypothetical protein HN348_15395 [Proteobacteria bacterium]|jgi:hypothetical protein|nr:hypothetical protein [Pseudomonadota bacterium]
MMSGCKCGSFQAYLPQHDRNYRGHEKCGAKAGTFGQVNTIRTNEYTLFVSPRVHGSAKRREETSSYVLTLQMRRDEMIDGAAPELDPWGLTSTDGGPQGEIDVISCEDKESAMSSQRWMRCRLHWDLTWGEDDGDLYFHSQGTDWVEAFL